MKFYVLLGIADRLDQKGIAVDRSKYGKCHTFKHIQQQLNRLKRLTNEKPKKILDYFTTMLLMKTSNIPGVNNLKYFELGCGSP